MPTIGASMQRLRPGFAGKAHRHTGSYLYQVAKGRGHSVINGQRFDWQERDIFCVPSWPGTSMPTPRRPKTPACSASATCVMDKLDLYREEALADNGGHQPVSTPATPA